MGDYSEDVLREAAACGDVKKIAELLGADGSLANSQHSINGWTALHWAAKRNQSAAVKLLLDSGADQSMKTSDGRSPGELTNDNEIARLLGQCQIDRNVAEAPEVSAGFTPSYLKNPSLPSYYGPKTKSLDNGASNRSPSSIQPRHEVPLSNSSAPSSIIADELVLKARVANSPERDFIEVELDNSNRTLSALVDLLCLELKVNITDIIKVRKLPNTILRKDKDVGRLKDFTEIELVLDHHDSSYNSNIGTPARFASQRSGDSSFNDFASTAPVLY